MKFFLFCFLFGFQGSCACYALVKENFGGPDGIRTRDLRDANAALYQLSYRPKGPGPYILLLRAIVNQEKGSELRVQSCYSAIADRLSRKKVNLSIPWSVSYHPLKTLSI
jgi:hypothetical protein